MKKLALAALLTSAFSTANAGVIMVSGDTNIGANGQFFSNVFGGQDVLSLNTGTSAWNTSNFTGTVDNYTASFSTATNLTSSISAGIDWLIAATDRLYSNTQLSFISEFLNNGGNVFVAGEGSLYTEERNAANQLLDYLGSSIDVLSSNFSGSSSALISNSYTAGAPSFSYAYSAALAGGTGLYGASNSRYNVAIENYSVGVPEPSVLALLGLGIAGFGLSRKRRRA